MGAGHVNIFHLFFIRYLEHWIKQLNQQTQLPRPPKQKQVAKISVLLKLDCYSLILMNLRVTHITVFDTNNLELLCLFYQYNTDDFVACMTQAFFNGRKRNRTTMTGT